MRIDADMILNLPIKVFVDGQEASDVVSADVERGVVERFARDADGRVKIDQKNESLVTFEVFGKVTFDKEPILFFSDG